MAEKEYIEREAIEKAFAEEIRTNYLDDYAKGFQAALLAIMSIPSADVAPVRHGHWIRPDVPNTRSYKWRCSECGQTAYWLHYGNRGNKNIICKYSYCPNCGTKMGGDTNGS